MERLVIFDLDGVLFESRDMHYLTLNGALRWAGYPPITPEDHATRFNGLPTMKKLEMLGITGTEAKLINGEKQASTSTWVAENVKYDEPLVRLFEDLHEAGWKIAVASNAISNTVLRSLQMLGLRSLCDLVVSADRVQHPKPDPEMWLLCMSRLGAIPATTVIVEDSPIGVAGAIATGARVVDVTGPQDTIPAIRAIMREGTIREHTDPDGR